VTEVDGPGKALQTVYDSASPDQQAHYLELMRHDPITGMAYLEGLGMRQEGNDSPSELD
jgi:hypothetical protein